MINLHFFQVKQMRDCRIEIPENKMNRRWTGDEQEMNMNTWTHEHMNREPHMHSNVRIEGENVRIRGQKCHKFFKKIEKGVVLMKTKYSIAGN